MENNKIISELNAVNRKLAHAKRSGDENELSDIREMVKNVNVYKEKPDITDNVLLDTCD